MSDSPIVLITGGSDGIGFETARRLLAAGAEPVAHLALPQTAVLAGGYCEGRVPAKAAPVVADRRAVSRLWKVSAQLAGVNA